jgi:hypothetical protein
MSWFKKTSNPFALKARIDHGIMGWWAMSQSWDFSMACKVLIGCGWVVIDQTLDPKTCIHILKDKND